MRSRRRFPQIDGPDAGAANVASGPPAQQATAPGAAQGAPRVEPLSPRPVNDLGPYDARFDEDVRQLRRRLAVAALFLAGVVGVGVIGYRVIDPGASVVDALYMTVITLTTVGFTEVVDLSGHPWGRLFTVALILVGMGGVLYFVSTATAFVLEGQLGHVFWRRRMEKEIARLSRHLIVCGCGETALYAAAELHAVRRRLVVVSEDPERVDRIRRELPGVPVVVGDPARDETLRRAGIERAAGILACTDSDRDNLVATLTARRLNPTARIVARVGDVEEEEKVRSVGADAVVSPTFIGGLRIASELIRPTVVTFLDQMLRDRDRNLRIDEVRIPEGSSAVGSTLGEIDLRNRSDAMLLACRTGGERWIYNPPPETEIRPGSTLILMGSPADVEAVRRALEGEMVSPPAPAPA